MYIFIHTYIFIIKKTNFNDYLNFLINIKYKPKEETKYSNIVYSSLNKIVDFNEEIINEENEIINEIINVSKEETNNVEEKPLIYIYNTHDTEEYKEPFISDYSITPNVKIAAFILKDHLNNLGINSTVEKRKIKTYLQEHNLNYYGSYDASRHYIKTSMKEQDYKILIDLHRDSIKRNLSVYEKDNKKYAKILFVLTTKHDNYKENEKFVKKLNSLISEKHKGLTRGIMYRKDAIFNQDLSPYAILLEVGGVDNTIEEINNTLSIVAEVINEYMQSEEFNG